jgi:hypothetical protein
MKHWLTMFAITSIVAVVACPEALAQAQGKPDGKSAKPSAASPGTQTEDELRIGAKAKTLQKETAKTAQKAKSKPSARVNTGDEDLEDLEVQRFRSKANSK